MKNMEAQGSNTLGLLATNSIAVRTRPAWGSNQIPPLKAQGRGRG